MLSYKTENVSTKLRFKTQKTFGGKDAVIYQMHFQKREESKDEKLYGNYFCEKHLKLHYLPLTPTSFILNHY
eukprot:Pgem_evm1s13931